MICEILSLYDSELFPIIIIYIMIMHFSGLHNQGFHKLFAYGCPDRGSKFDKRKDKKLMKRLYNICN